MKKTPTLFKRNPDNMKEVLDEHHPDCDWVFNGEGVATRKYDGTCCVVINGELFKRREVKKGKPDPDNFVLADEDQNTGKRVGWVPVIIDSKEDRWHAEAFHALQSENAGFAPSGTYELLGPKIQGNPENHPRHVLKLHADAEKYPDAPTDMEGIKQFLAGKDIEGLVWHHPDGRMAKIKKRDFGMRRK